MFHPHIHCVIPNGGLTEAGQFRSGSEKFLFPVKVLSRLFRGKFMGMFIRAMKSEELRFHGTIEKLNKQAAFTKLRNQLYNKEWVVYSKRTFSDPEAVIEYLGRYTHRSAISNNWLLKLENGYVTFKWRDYRDNKEKIMTLTAHEFIRRFLMHILPSGFQRIRHYGIMANCNRQTKLTRCQRLLGKTLQKARFCDMCSVEVIKMITGIDVTLCQHCKRGRMVPLRISYPRSITEYHIFFKAHFGGGGVYVHF